MSKNKILSMSEMKDDIAASYKAARDSIKTGDTVVFDGFRWSKDRKRLMPYKGARAAAVITSSVVSRTK